MFLKTGEIIMLIQFSVSNFLSFDGKETFKITSDQWYTDGSSAQSAPFDKPFYILLNLAVGGNYDGGIQPGADFTSRSMYVDYVRVYEKIV